MKKIKYILISFIILLVSFTSTYADSINNINNDTNKTILNYKRWKTTDNIIFYDFQDQSWIMLDNINKQYVYCDINNNETYFDNIETFKKFISNKFKNITIKEIEPFKNVDGYFNPYNYSQVNIELEKIPNNIKNTLKANGIKITYDKLISDNNNRILHGLYCWDSQTIIYNKTDFSIEYAFIHEIGHAIDDIYNLSSNKVLLNCYNNKEIIFADLDNNDYFYTDIHEYIAQSIQEYYNKTLNTNTKTYKELNQILNNL